jgi:AcrR family transcriptional regulator
MDDRKNNRTKEQGAETKKKLLECAEILFQQQDYKDVSVEAIAKMAGMTKSTFYVHFESKDKLFISLFESYIVRLDYDYEVFLQGLSAELSAVDTLLTFAGAVIDLMINKVGYPNLRNVYILQLTTALNMEIITGNNRKIYELFTCILKCGIERGEFKASMPPEHLTRHFMIALRGLIYEFCMRYPNYDLKEQTLAHFKILLDGIVA